jgi:2',3'-cyclic-nucleotide 2'-phosphodiesterase
MLILAIGDIIGKPGRLAVQKLLPSLKHRLKLDLVIGNAENSAGGLGVTRESAHELLSSGIDVLTTGNHVWHHKDVLPLLEDETPIMRPLNYPPGVTGKGYVIRGNMMVVNLLGRTFIGNFDCPFRTMDKLLAELRPRPPVIIIDFHAEATSEKMALGYYLDGKVSAIVGTHTHVGTVDARIMPNGTACVTDIGMVGPENSVIGDDPDSVLKRFLTLIPSRLTVGKDSMCIFNSVLIEVDKASGKALKIQRIDLETA